MEKSNQCPCGNQQLYSNCCEILLLGKESAKTAEALMRSRYTAYTKKAIDYLVQTTHPKNRKPHDRMTIEGWANQVTWHELKVLQARGGEKDEEGEVEFIAFYTERGKKKQLHEISSFRKKEGKWYYEEGKILPTDDIKVGRNDPCPCNSGKKYKKCCGK